MNTDLEFSDPQQIEPFYRQLVELLLHDIDSLDENEQQIRLEESRIAIADLQQEELANLFESAYGDTSQNLVEIDLYAAAIYQIVLDNSLEVILSIQNQPLKHYRTELDEESQQKIFQEVCQQLNPIDKTADILPFAQKLYDWLIQPAEEILQENEIETLVFILDRFLRSLPMTVLHDGNQYLIEKYKIVHNPGLQLFSANKIEELEFSLLIGGITQAQSGFPPLSEVNQEIAQISPIIPTQVLLDAEFTIENFTEKLEQSSFSVIHLITHCQLSSQADRTFLVTWGDRLKVNHLSKIRSNKNISKESKLLVLTACQTAENDANAILALVAIAKCFSARSTIATLWQVRDRSTTCLITEFYRLLTQPHISIAEALRQAQISLLQDPQYQHPYYWSPFVLVGHWW